MSRKFRDKEFCDHCEIHENHENLTTEIWSYTVVGNEKDFESLFVVTIMVMPLLFVLKCYNYYIIM